MKRNILTITLTVAIVTMTLGVGLFTAPVSAQEECGVVDGILGECTDSGDASIIDKAQAAVSGALGYAEGKIASLTEEPKEDDLSTVVDRTESRWSNYGDEYESYYAERGSAVDSVQTVKVTWETEDASATRYITADINADDEYTNTQIVQSLQDGEEADEWVSLCNEAALNSDDEVQQVYDSYIRVDKSLDAGHVSRIKGQYGDDIKTSMLGHSDPCSAGDGQ